MFNMNAKQMEKMMKQMGIKTVTIEAEEVIIKAKEKEIVISSPQITKINMSGQETFQIVGEVSERSYKGYTKEDVKIAMEQTGKTEEECIQALEENSDLAEVILKLKD